MILLQDEGVLKAYMNIMVNPVYTPHLDHDEPPPNCQVTCELITKLGALCRVFNELQKRIRRAGYVRS
ncbi:unnamed protein product [Brugia pahangi]|uniref:Helitron helicase n=1 Tax=Brugia pahangi TaxID=6280 RepID=A0A0N4TV07_BRUPA|nr:unnamed protein product [Brugia pahangi]